MHVANCAVLWYGEHRDSSPIPLINNAKSWSRSSSSTCDAVFCLHTVAANVINGRKILRSSRISRYTSCLDGLLQVSPAVPFVWAQTALQSITSPTGVPQRMSNPEYQERAFEFWGKGKLLPILPHSQPVVSLRAGQWGQDISVF